MIILYVYDCIIISRNEKIANEIFQELDKRGYKLTDEGTMEEYLGIMITHEKQWKLPNVSTPTYRQDH